MEKEKELSISLRNLYNNDIISQNLKQIVQMEGAEMDESEEESERNYFYNDVTDSRENECMSKECIINREFLEELDDQYSALERSYFDIEIKHSEKNVEVEKKVKTRLEDFRKLKKKLDLFEKSDLNELNSVQKLSELELKVFEVLNKISKYKEKFVEEELEKRRKKRKKLCVICMENSIKILIKPCCHLCLCEICCLKIESCPICRKLISVKEKININ